MDENFDLLKTKMLKYVIYKKRTEEEVRLKFRDIDDCTLEDLITFLKDNNYINDDSYIKRAVDEFIALKNMSIKEIKYKLLNKGLSSSLIDNYISQNYDDLIDFEIQSAQNIYNKKSRDFEDIEITQFLIKKGYREESIKQIQKE